MSTPTRTRHNSWSILAIPSLEGRSLIVGAGNGEGRFRQFSSKYSNFASPWRRSFLEIRYYFLLFLIIVCLEENPIQEN